MGALDLQQERAVRLVAREQIVLKYLILYVSNIFDLNNVVTYKMYCNDG